MTKPTNINKLRESNMQRGVRLMTRKLIPMPSADFTVNSEVTAFISVLETLVCLKQIY